MRRIIVIALCVYLLMIAAGAGVYLYLGDTTKKAPPPALKASDTAPASGKAAEKKSAGAARQQRADALRSEMKCVDRKGITLYTFDYPKKPEPGVYLRPFVVSDGMAYELKFDVYYFYDIDDAQKTAWIHGDALEITTDSGVHTLFFSSRDRRDKMAMDAQDLAENYVHTATREEESLLEKIGASQHVSLRYYQQESGLGRSQHLSREEIHRIHDMVEFYHLEKQEGEQ